jgi:moderate conductance mechanosensitive channel
MRALAIVVAATLTLALAAGPSRAQSASAPNAAAALTAAVAARPAPAAKPAPGQTVSAADLQSLVATLKSDTDRARLVAQLQALIAIQKTATPAVPAATTATQGIIEGLAAKFDGIGAQLIDIVGIARAAPQAVAWLSAQAASPAARMQWLDVAARLAIVFLAAAFAAIALARLLRPVRARFALRRSEQFARWLALYVAALVLNLLPVAAFAIVATLALALLHPAASARPLAALAIAAILRAQFLLAFAWVTLLSPAYPYFLRLGEESRTYLYIWARRFILWTVYGFALAQTATALGAPAAITDLTLRLVTVVLAGLAIVFILQNQAAVTAYLRGPGDQAKPISVFRMIRVALADTWHILAMVYVLGSFGSYLVDLHGGVAFVLRATAISVAVLIGAGLATRLIHQLNRRGFELSTETRQRFPGLQMRANRYLPGLISVVTGLIYILAIVLLLQAWGTDIVAWLELQTVRRLVGGLASIAVVVVIAVAIWELVSAAIERALGRSDSARNAQVSARLRTLLPLARSTLLIAIVTMAGIIVLSQLGVDIAPLLAGAGIIGIAVGLGSQQLVRDIINGLFILIENTIVVGDYVDVGGGHAGTVEEISIRSMRLRDGNGAMHTIPFSSVTAIVNTNRGIGNAAVTVNLAPGADTDRAARILAEIAVAMRREREFQTAMLSDLQYWGVDKVDGANVTLVGQIVCTDTGRWPVQREFNRRVMQRFQAEGIAFALPTQNVIVREPSRAPDIRPGDPAQVTPFRAPRDRG